MNVPNRIPQRMTFFLLLVIASSIATHARPQNSQEKDKAPQQEKKPEDKKPDTAAKGGIEILSDTLGVEFRPYVEQIRSRIYPAWLRAIPDVAREPEKKQGTAILEFDILKDGRVKGLKLTQSSGDKSMDLAPQMAIISVAPMPQLPVAFRGDYLQIRCRFIYNPGTRAQINPSAGGQKK